MNIAKNHWVTFKCSVINISLHLLVPSDHSFLEQFYSILLQLDYRKNTNNPAEQSTRTFISQNLPRWTISKPKTLLKTTSEGPNFHR